MGIRTIFFIINVAISFFVCLSNRSISNVLILLFQVRDTDCRRNYHPIAKNMVKISITLHINSNVALVYSNRYTATVFIKYFMRLFYYSVKNKVGGHN